MRKRKAAFLPLLAVSIAASFYLSFTPVSAYSQVLKPGMEGSEVTQLQNDLKKLGYFSTESTGYYGDITAEAVEKLQKDNGYIPDGIAGPDTYSLIDKLLKRQEENSGRSITYSSPVLKKGMSGDDVVQLQKMLKELGYFNEECTGYYGDVTVSSVRSLQRQYGYIQDGVAGNDTISLLSRKLVFAQEKVRDLTFNDVFSRTASQILKLAHYNGKTTEKGVAIDIRFSRQELAEMVGTTRETVSRVISKFKKEKSIAEENDMLIILNERKLKSWI
jgi:murein L,D-transpeptidase YcbB/YkuD